MNLHHWLNQSIRVGCVLLALCVPLAGKLAASSVGGQITAVDVAGGTVEIDGIRFSLSDRSLLRQEGAQDRPEVGAVRLRAWQLNPGQVVSYTVMDGVITVLTVRPHLKEIPQ